MGFLETVEIEDSIQAGHFRMRVQWVNRPNLDFRGFSGRIIGGAVRPGLFALRSMGGFAFFFVWTKNQNCTQVPPTVSPGSSRSFFANGIETSFFRRSADVSRINKSPIQLDSAITTAISDFAVRPALGGELHRRPPSRSAVSAT